jgi:hypothetical protein
MSLAGLFIQIEAIEGKYASLTFFPELIISHRSSCVGFVTVPGGFPPHNEQNV